MTTDLWMLVAAAGLQWVLIMAAATPNFLIKGMPWALGNRHDDAGVEEMPDWHGRLERASQNLAENLPLFAILVLVVHVAGKADATSALGAQVFLGARVVHALLYVAGVPVVRTLAWAVSIVGMGMVAAALLG